MAEIIKNEIDKNKLLEKVKEHFRKGDRLLSLNGYIDSEKENVIVYCFDNSIERHMIMVKGEDEIPTITEIYQGATWFEEEIQEMMPVKFTNLKASGRLFLPEEFKDGNGKILVLPLAELKKLKNK